MRFAAGQFLGDRQSRRCFAGIELADMRPTVPRHEVHAHTHDEAHLLVLHRGVYLSSAQGMPEICVEPVVLLNPPGTHHRDCFHSLDDARFLTVSLDAALWTRPTRARRCRCTPRGCRRWRCRARIGYGGNSWISTMPRCWRSKPKCRNCWRAARVRPNRRRGLRIRHGWRARTAAGRCRQRARHRRTGPRGRPASGVLRPRVPPRLWLFPRRPTCGSDASRPPSWCSCGGTRPLAEVAGACGFADQSHMSHALQRAIGLSPCNCAGSAGCRLRICKNAAVNARRLSSLAQRELPA
ncbi:MAG: hypothetical protein IPO74_04580 [Thermomonas sp.]|nr:hypothetical protein [Thermomonas sp.]